MRLKDKIAVVTGAASGIGKEIAIAYLREGARVAIADLDLKAGQAAAREMDNTGTRAMAVAMDVTQEDQVEAGMAQVVKAYGGIDVLVSNAGISKLGPLADGDVDGWSAMIDVNLRGVLNGIAAAMPVFRRQGSGHFVTTVSTAGLKIVPEMGVYAGTKNAVRTVMESLRQESTDGVIRTTSISPGFVRTELGDSIDDPAARAEIRSTMDEIGLAPEAVARAVAFAIEQPHDVEIGEIVIRPTVQG